MVVSGGASGCFPSHYCLLEKTGDSYAMKTEETTVIDA